MKELPLDAWRKRVQERDDYHCIQCGSAEDILSHHIRPRALGGKNTLRNGATLCRNCHSKTHTGELSTNGIYKSKYGHSSSRKGKRFDKQIVVCVTSQESEALRQAAQEQSDSLYHFHKTDIIRMLIHKYVMKNDGEVKIREKDLSQ